MIFGGRRVTLRAMKEPDIDRVYEIECASFNKPWTRASFVSEVTNNICARYVVIVENGRVVGYGGMWLIIDEAHVNNIAVDPACRSRGYGRLLMKELMRVAYNALEICKMTLEVRVTNDEAIKLYTSMGFEVAGTRKGYYDDTGEDAYVMWCHNTIVNLI